MINAFYNMHYSYFSTVDFSYALFSFTDGTEVKINKGYDQETLFEDGVERISSRITYTVSRPGWEEITWEPQDVPAFRGAKLVSKYLPFLTRISPEFWSDDRTGEAVRYEELIHRYADFLPTRLLGQEDSEVKEVLNDIVGSVSCSLVETQRLLRFTGENARDFRYEGRSKYAPELVVEEKAKKLKRLLLKELEEYASLSQRLDRSFPNRMIKAHGKKRSSTDQILNRFVGLEKKREELQNFGVIEKEFEPLARPSTIDPGILNLLSIYVEDAEKKLSVFNDIKSKISVFTEILNSRFLDKYVQVNRECGFQVVSQKSGHEIALSKLSSGEQHQLVMLFELLFEIKEDSLILIDEPEISLHVVWQKKFISDLMKIIEVNSFDVVIATHSPQLIGRWSNLAVELASVDGE
ncbi:hypothetical protein AUQ42_08250 [Thalassospira sp. MCCC 1A02491]|nr:hypothetical protein AUQ42_08250 [Thalassospira sp. MCCC 1A02491]